MTQTRKSKQVVKSKDAKVCKGPVCPLCSPLGLGLFIVGFLVVVNTGWPYQLIGWLVLALSYLQAIVRFRT